MKYGTLRYLSFRKSDAGSLASLLQDDTLALVLNGFSIALLSPEIHPLVVVVGSRHSDSFTGLATLAGRLHDRKQDGAGPARQSQEQQNVAELYAWTQETKKGV